MFTVLDRVSLPGIADKANEDICGASGDWAWIIDTSIFPGTKPVMRPDSDATWLARFTDERLSGLAGQATDGIALVRHVMEEARTAFMAVAPPDRHDFATWPLGAMTLVRRRSSILDVWTFGDTTAFVQPPGEPVLTMGEGPHLRELEAAKAAELLRETGARPTAIQYEPLFLQWLGGRRERQKKTSEAPALLTLDPRAADRLTHETAPCPDGTLILLASDGFSALVDLYDHTDADGLLEAARTSGLAALAAQARRIETEQDPAGERFPRFKVSDDTTALLLRA